MDYFAPGLREFSRILTRQWLRVRLRVEGNRLAQAEATLGLLGWQQADFDEATQEQVGRIVEYESDQARATNESAATGRALRELKDARATGQQHFDRESAAIEDERRSLGNAHSQIEHKLAEKRRIEPDLEQQMPELDRELREKSRLYAGLLGSDPQTPQIKAELLRLRERIVAIPNAKTDLRMLHLRAVTEVRALEAELEQDRAKLAELEARERQLTDAFKKADGELAEQIEELERQRDLFDKRFDSLEGAKANPYREVGRVLADSGVGPVNQPQALDAVRRHRAAVHEYEYALAASVAQTADENPVALRLSMRLWIGLALGTVVFIIALIALG